MCRGESSCILPISPAAVHTNPTGSRLAIRHFTEYLEQFPDDLEIRWLLNLAHMTLGEYPDEVDPAYLLDLDRFLHSEFDIGKFRDVGHLLGVNRFNQAGGAIMDDFDNDGLLDLAVTTLDPTEPMAFYRNTGDGTFEDRRSGGRDRSARRAGLLPDRLRQRRPAGHLHSPRRLAAAPDPALASCATTATGRFTDVTAEPACSTRSIPTPRPGPITTTTAGSTSSSPASGSRTACTTTAATARSRKSPPGAGVDGKGQAVLQGLHLDRLRQRSAIPTFSSTTCGLARLYHNERDGTFTDVTATMGIDGPRRRLLVLGMGLRQRRLARHLRHSYDRTLDDVVSGLWAAAHVATRTGCSATQAARGSRT